MGIVDNFQETKPIFTELIADNLPEINRDVVCINLEMGHFDTATLKHIKKFGKIRLYHEN